jgi:hypothetical protein
MEMSGDFAIAFLRVMPEAADPAKFKANMAAISKVKLQTFSEFQGKPRKPVDKTVFPAYGKASDTYAHHFLPVMQFVLNHTSFDRNNEMDQKALAALRPLGVKLGKTYHGSEHGEIDGQQLARVFGKVAKKELAIWNDPRADCGPARRRRPHASRPPEVRPTDLRDCLQTDAGRDPASDRSVDRRLANSRGR